MGACLSSSGGTKTDAAPKRLAVAEQPKSILNKQEGTTTSKLNKNARCREVYHIGKTLGTGGFSVVKLAKEKATGREYACKVMALPPIGANTRDHDSTREDIFKEIEVLVGLAHDNVVYLKEYFEEGDRVFLILELLMGGELLDAVLAKGSYSEADARLCFVQLLRGVHYLHSRGVCHRDLKLENLLLAASGDIGRIKIADFGLAKKATKNDFVLDTICGTPQYVAPEVIAGGEGLAYTPAVDLWAAGVVLYVLLGGYPPFYDESEPELFKLIRKGEYRFDDPVWDTVSDSAKDLLGHLLVVDPEQRYSAAEALSHPWLHSPIEDHALDLTRVNMRRNLAAKRRFKAAVRAVIAQQRLAHLVEQVQRGDAAPKSAILLNSEDDMKAATEAARRSELQQIQKELQCTEETSVHQFQGRSSTATPLAV